MYKDMWGKFELSGRIEDYLNYKKTEYTNCINTESENKNADNVERDCNQRTYSGGQQEIY
jgi:hypothetical protein